MSELTDDRLLPCPGCGRNVGAPHDDEGDGIYFVDCAHCGWRGPRAYNLTDAWNRWNRRAAASTSTEGAGVKEPAVLSVAAEAEANGMPVTARCLRKLAAKGGRTMSDRPHCIACAQPIKPGDFVFNDVSGDLIHAACAGPERESFVRDLDTAEPLRKNDPKPRPWKWTSR